MHGYELVLELRLHLGKQGLVFVDHPDFGEQNGSDGLRIVKTSFLFGHTEHFN